VSAPAFTPGPWRIAKRGEDEAFYVVERDEPNEPSRHAYRVAHVLDYNELQQNAANACLIAAAPDLYAALAALLPAVDDEIEQRKFSGNDEDWSGLERLSSAAHAALAAAKGERT
jgi:hypothetical protein